MASINNVVLVGNVTRDPEIKYSQSGTAVCGVGLAMNRKYGEKEEVTFVDVTFFGKLAEIMGEHVVKGQQIGVTGRLKQETWETDGQKRSRLVVIAENMQMLGGKKNGNSNGGSANDSAGEPESVSVGSTDEIPF